MAQEGTRVMAKVFLSYSSQDKAVAQKIASDLQALRIDLWSDNDLQLGEIWKDVISEQLRQSDAVVVLISPANLQSEWTTDEWSSAFFNSKRIIPVLVNGATFWHLPARLQGQAFDLNVSYATDIRRLADTLREVTSLPDPRPAELVNIDTLAERAVVRVLERLGVQTRHALAGSPIRPDSAFVIISFEQVMDPTFDAIKAAATRVGLNAERIKDVRGDFMVTETILAKIDSARLIVADLTFERPNVYFELGYARGRGKTVITLLREGSKAHVDVRGWSYIEYIDSRPLEEELVARFAAELQVGGEDA